MAESDADRQRRSRAHRAGDHRYCLADRCPALRAAERPSDAVGDGSTVDAMRAWSEALDISPDDPRKVLVEAALVLADLVDRRQAMPAAARELSSCVESILDFGERGSVVDELRARRAGRRVAMLVENANRGGTVA